jgi:hypothetical protein
MFRTLAALAFAVGADVYLFEGRYSNAVAQLIHLTLQHF